MKTSHKAFALRVFGLIVCVAPPVIATLEYFPLWFSQTDTAVSVLSAMMIALCCIPFFKQIRAYFKGTPAAWAFFLALWVASMSLNKLMDGIETIAFYGMISNLAGGAIFKIKKHIRAKEGVNNG